MVPGCHASSPNISACHHAIDVDRTGDKGDKHDKRMVIFMPCSPTYRFTVKLLENPLLIVSGLILKLRESWTYCHIHLIPCQLR
jgi:hypothetical protein